MGLLQTLQHVYETKYKLLLFIPLILLLLSIGQIGYQYATTGGIVQRSVSLQGGISITTTPDIINIEQFLNDAKKVNARVDNTIRTLSTDEIIVEVSGLEERDVLQLLKLQNIPQTAVTLEVTSGTLGKSFYTAALGAILIAFILMGIVVYTSFRTIIPSIAVLVAAATDIVVTLAIFNIIGYKLSSAGMAAFLMLIGYSVDTDILLTTRTLKRSEGTLNERIYSSIKTGMFTTITTITATSTALILTNSEVISQIMIIIIIGMLVDIPSTWLQNVGIIRWYKEKEHSHAPNT